MNSQNQNQLTNALTDEQDSAVVYTSTPFGGIQGQRIAGNRKRDPLGAFRYSIARLVSLPSDMRQLVVDQAVWLFGSSGVALAVKLGGDAVALVLGLPLAAFILTLVVAQWYVPEMRLMAAIRLLIVAIGVILAII